MEHPQTPQQRQARITQAEERLRGAAMCMSEAQELVTLAKQRLALARRALEEGALQGTIDLPPHVPTKPSPTP